MKKATIIIIMLLIPLGGCKKEKKLVEPQYVLTRWASAIQELNYRQYADCEAYPKSESVFREIFRDYYYTDVMAVSIEQPDKNDVRKDYEGNPYIHTSVSFEGNVVKRSTGKPYQVVRGDSVFIMFTQGKRSKQGWLMSNRTIITVNR